MGIHIVLNSFQYVYPFLDTKISVDKDFSD